MAMKLIKREIDKTGSGYVILVPEESEDLWHVYNLISVGDNVRASTIRRVAREKTDTGSKDTKESKRITLTVNVETVDYDPSSSTTIRLKGRNIEENKFVKLGAYHTLELECHKQFTLFKSIWDPIDLERLSESTDVVKRAEVAAVMIDEGLANLCLLTEQMTIVRARINMPIPRKGRQSQQVHDKAIDRFFTVVYEAIHRHVDFTIVKCFIIAGPGFVKEQFLKFISTHAVQTEDKNLLENRSKIMVTSASSAHVQALKEVLADKVVLDKMQDTKAAKEVMALNKFFSTLSSDPTRATYGYKSVNKANEQAAIDCLLISDKLFRANTVQDRKKYVSLVELVKENGGDVKIFSSMHVSGSQLDKVSGVAATLRFPLPNLEDESESESESDESEKSLEKNPNHDEDSLDSAPSGTSSTQKESTNGHSTATTTTTTTTTTTATKLNPTTSTSTKPVSKPTSPQPQPRKPQTNKMNKKRGATLDTADDYKYSEYYDDY